MQFRGDRALGMGERITFGISRQPFHLHAFPKSLNNSIESACIASWTLAHLLVPALTGDTVGAPLTFHREASSGPPHLLMGRLSFLLPKKMGVGVFAWIIVL